MKFILSYIKKFKWFIAFGVFLKLLGAFGELMLPYVLEHLIDDVVPTENMTAVILWGVGMMALALLVRQLNVWANHRAAKVARDGTYEIRRDLFWKTLQLSGNQVDEFALPSLISRMTSDSYNVQNFIQSVQTKERFVKRRNACNKVRSVLFQQFCILFLCFLFLLADTEGLF